MAAVQQDGRALKHASAALKSDKEVAMAAVQQNWRALYYASAAMKSDKEVVMAAVQQDGEALRYASKALQNNKPFVRQLLANLTKATHAKTQEIQSLKAKNHNLTSLLSVRVHNLETNEDEIMISPEDTLRDSRKRKRDLTDNGSSVEAQMHQLDKKIKVKMEEAGEDLEDANELTEQTALMLNSWQSKFDDLAELAKNHGAGVAAIGAIRSRKWNA